MNDTEQRAAAKQFALDWQEHGDEKQETQAFWLALLQKIFGVEEPEKTISFERRVEVDDPKTGKSTTKFIDGYIPQTRVLIEQKGMDIACGKVTGSPMAPCFRPISRPGGMAAIFPSPNNPAGSSSAISENSISTI